MLEMRDKIPDGESKKGRRMSPRHTDASDGLSQQALGQIGALTAAGSAQLPEHLDGKWEAVERRCDTLEHTLFEERSKAEATKNRQSETERGNQALRDHLESLDNRRLDSLILRCKDLGA